MALISSQTLKKEDQMSQRIAERDIVQKNAAGQNVVVVAKGQPIPDGLEVPDTKKKAPAQNKARSRSKNKSR